jgi:adenosylcobinamide-phosphate synthase
VVNCWRRDAWLWKVPNEGVIWPPQPAPSVCSWEARPRQASRLTDRRPSRAGALPEAVAAEGSTPGRPADARRTCAASVGLVWRSVVLWMLLLALLSLANLVG